MQLHPVIETILRQMEATGFVPYSESSPQQARDRLAAVRASRPPPTVAPLAEIRDVTIPGEPALPARVYKPNGPVRGTLLFMHGGGWVVGDLETSHTIAAAIAAAGGCNVVSLDYRLAPEHPYPAALDDVMRALAWLRPEDGPFLVGGDSAGGNLAAAATLKARAAGGPAIAGQVLIYPALDPSLATGSHGELGSKGYVLSSRDMAWFWQHYAGSGIADPLIAPTLAESLSGLPPAYVAVASHDPLRDEGLAYAERLRASGVAAEAKTYDGMVHGFAGFVGIVDVADQAAAEIGAWIRRTLSNPVRAAA